jgi:hypothetical protein
VLGTDAFAPKPLQDGTAPHPTLDLRTGMVHLQGLASSVADMEDVDEKKQVAGAVAYHIEINSTKMAIVPPDSGSSPLANYDRLLKRVLERFPAIKPEHLAEWEHYRRVFSCSM